MIDLLYGLENFNKELKLRYPSSPLCILEGVLMELASNDLEIHHSMKPQLGPLF